LHDFAGAFLAAAPSFDPADQHTGPLAAKIKKPGSTGTFLGSCSWSIYRRLAHCSVS
jgi:hypothetical protein